MKKIFAMLLALLMVLLTAACGETPAPEAELPAQTAEITHPEFLPQELAESAAYKDALTHPAVICYNGEVLTSPRDVRAAAQAWQQGEAAELYCYHFYSYPATEYSDANNGVYAVRYVHPEDGSAPYMYYLDTSENSDGSRVPNRWYAPLVPSTENYSLTSLTLTEYGILMTEDEVNSDPCSSRAVSCYDLFPDYADKPALEKRFIDPIYYDLICGMTFSSPDEIDRWALLFDDIYSCTDPDDNGGNLWKKYPDCIIPVEDIAALLSQYFDISTDMLRASFAGEKYSYYDSAADTIRYEGGRGGYCPVVVITDYAETTAEEEALATLEYYTEDMYTGAPQASYRLTVRLLPDGSFRYLSAEKVSPSEG